MRKLRLCIMFLCASLIMCSCNKADDIQITEQLEPTFTLVGETEPVEYVGTETYAPIMPEENYTMAPEYDVLEEDTTAATVSINMTLPPYEETETEQSTTFVTGFTNENKVTTTSTAENTTTTTVYATVDIAQLPTLKERLSINTVAHKYFYSKLSTKEQRVYDALLEAALNFGAVVEFEESVTQEEYERILGLVFVQNPELYWLRGSVDLDATGKTANLYYLCTQEQKKSMDAFLAEKIKNILSTVPADASDLRKLQVCHDYICKNTSFMKGGTSTSNIIGPLVDGVGQCLGYSKAFQFLCNLMEIPCLIITGTNDSDASHAWNVVQLGGDWYNVDCTWDDPVLKVADAQNVSYMYFCVRDIDIHNRTHFNVNRPDLESDWTYFTPPVCDGEKYNVDKVYGYYARTYEEGYEMLREEMLNAVKNGSTVVHVKYATQEVYLDAIERLKSKKELLNLKNDINTLLGYNKIQSIAANRENSLNYFEVYLTY